MEFQNRCQKFSKPFRLTEYILVQLGPRKTVCVKYPLAVAFL